MSYAKSSVGSRLAQSHGFLGMEDGHHPVKRS